MANFRILRSRLVEQKTPRSIVGKVYPEGRDWYGITVYSDTPLGPFPRQIPAGEAVYAQYLLEAAKAAPPVDGATSLNKKKLRTPKTTKRSKPVEPPAPSPPKPPKPVAPPKLQQKKKAPKTKTAPPVAVPLEPESRVEPELEPTPEVMHPKKPWGAPIPEAMPPAKKHLPPARDLQALIRFLDAAFKKLPSNRDGVVFVGERREHPATSPAGTFGVDHGTFSRGRHWAAFGVSDGTVQVEYLLAGEIPPDPKVPGARAATDLHVAEALFPLIAVAYQRGRLSVTLPRDTLRLTFAGDITGSLTGPQYGGAHWARHSASRTLGIY